jgi:hypothetical protein
MKTKQDMTMSSFAKFCGIPQSTVSRNVNLYKTIKLTKYGLVPKGTKVLITKKGRKRKDEKLTN